jgi:hypothetical protein
MMTFRCWSTDLGQTQADAILLEARDRRDAAERFAREEADYDSDRFDVLDVTVIDCIGGPVIFRVHVDTDPRFVAHFLRSEPFGGYR